MNKIPVVSWMKMIAIVSIHLCLIGWVAYNYREPIGSCASAGWGHVVEGYGACEQYVVDVWDKVPTSAQLKDGFIGILTLKHFR